MAYLAISPTAFVNSFPPPLYWLSANLLVPKVQVRFTLDDDSIHCSDNGLMCPFEMRTVNLEALGARTEVSKRGSLRAVFTADKISELEMCFDPIAVWRQMQQARGESDQGDDALGASAKIASSASQGTQTRPRACATHVTKCTAQRSCTCAT